MRQGFQRRSRAWLVPSSQNWEISIQHMILGENLSKITEEVEKC